MGVDLWRLVASKPRRETIDYCGERGPPPIGVYLIGGTHSIVTNLE